MVSKILITVAVIGTTLIAETADKNDRYNYSSVADRIHKEAQVRPPDPVGDIRDRIRVDPYQDIRNDVYGKQNREEE